MGLRGRRRPYSPTEGWERPITGRDPAPFSRGMWKRDGSLWGLRQFFHGEPTPGGGPRGSCCEPIAAFRAIRARLSSSNRSVMSAEGNQRISLRLANLPLDRLLFGDTQQEADVVMLVGRLVPPGGNLVYIDVQDHRTRSSIGRLSNPRSPILPLPRAGRSQHVGLAVDMAPELQPALELAVMREQRRAGLVRNDPRRGRDMTGIEAVPMEARSRSARASTPGRHPVLVGMAVLVRSSRRTTCAVHARRLAKTRRPAAHVKT